MSIRTKLDHGTSSVLALVIAAFWAAIILTHFWNFWAADLSALWFAGYFYHLGEMGQVYASPERFFGEDMPPSWVMTLASLGHAGEHIFPFVYPPIWAALLAPVAGALDPLTFFNIVYVWHVIVIIWAVFLAFRIAEVELPVFIWAAISFGLLWGSFIAMSAIIHNQPQITVTFLVILAVERLKAGRSVTAGAVLGLAAAIKLTPLFLVILFLWYRDWRAIFAFGIVSGSIGALSFLIAGPELHWVFLEKLKIISSQIAVMKVNFTVETFLFEMHAFLTGTPIGNEVPIDQFPVDEPLWITVATKLLMAAFLGWTLFACRNLDRADTFRILPVSLMLIATLFGPLGWTHHYLLQLLLLPTVFALYSRNTATMILLAFLCLTNTRLFAVFDANSITIHLHMIAGVLTMVGLLAVFTLAPAARKSMAPARVRRDERKSAVPAE